VSAIDILIICVLVVLLIGLLRANNIIGANPRQQVETQEQMAGKFPSGLSFAEKIKLTRTYGVSGRPGGLKVLVIVLVVIFLFVLINLS
jgi:hypothetical protein